MSTGEPTDGSSQQRPGSSDKASRENPDGAQPKPLPLSPKQKAANAQPPGQSPLRQAATLDFGLTQGEYEQLIARLCACGRLHLAHAATRPVGQDSCRKARRREWCGQGERAADGCRSPISRFG
jgi:hypothetical protein